MEWGCGGCGGCGGVGDVQVWGMCGVADVGCGGCWGWGDVGYVCGFLTASIWTLHLPR